MRWSIIRLIWFRELRDQLRDRRTVLMIVGLPLILYPLIGFGLMQFAVGFLRKTGTVGIQGAEHLPQPSPLSAGLNPLPVTAWLSLGPHSGIDQLAGTAVFSRLAQQGLGQDYPPLVVPGEGTAHFVSSFFDSPRESEGLTVKLLPGEVSPIGDDLDQWIRLADRTALDAKQVDVLLLVPPDFQKRLERGERPVLGVLSREGDERSRLASQRLLNVLIRWKLRLKEVRLLRYGLPADYDEPIAIKDPEHSKPPARQAAEGLFDMLARVVPFMIVMWSLAGALYPAVDLCAGEKERGTMETLLISPAGREEIVLGKFLAIWVFSAATALLNLISMGATTWHFRTLLPSDALRPLGLAWCVILVLPLSAFFSALCLAVGAYARSSKEGQYYLMPLFLLTMPLVFLSLAPGVELNPFYSMVPVTGVALLMQRLMTTASPDQSAYFYFLPVLAPMALYGWFAIRWAVEQFQREEVLFREAERLDVGLWLRHLFRDKEAYPSTGEALFCFALLVVLRWMSFGLGGDLSLLARTGISAVAFLTAPPLFMALVLTTRPRQSLGLVLPGAKAVGGALLLVVCLLPPMVEITQWTLGRFSGLHDLMKEHHPLTEELQKLSGEGQPDLTGGQALFILVTLAVLPAVSEELAFRGFILSGLRRRYPPGKAIALTSFLFALYHMNVFQFIPALFLGLVLGVLAVRSGSILPGMLFHFLYNGLLIGMVLIEAVLRQQGLAASGESLEWVRRTVAIGCAILALPLLWYCLRRLSDGQPLKEGASPGPVGSREVTPQAAVPSLGAVSDAP
jgi:sodium transport system permease protein